MDIKDGLVLHGMTWAASEDIAYNNIGAFKTSNSNTPGYYVVQWTDNVYNLQEQYTCNSFYHQVIIPEG